MQTNNIQALIADLKAGKMVVLLDDEDRENEGDLVMLAEHVTPAAINFMARYGRGLICLPMTQARCQHLNLPLMVNSNSTQFGTNFTVAIEAATGVTTGISAADRARTIQVAVAANSTAADIVQPGHIFPIMAQPGGVLTRAGHTEASCDLAHLAGCEPAAVICEILNEDGTMARRPELELFAARHQLKLGTIAELIRYRLQQETTVKPVYQQTIATEFGPFEMLAFEEITDKVWHWVLYKPKVDNQPMPVWIETSDPILDLPGQLAEHCPVAPGRWTLNAAMRYIGQQTQGVIILLGYPLDNQHWLQQMTTTVQAPISPELKDWRVIGVGAQILAQLEVDTLVVLGTKTKFAALSGFNLSVLEYLPYSKQHEFKVKYAPN
jgi:3,4-dihydroxy 2-butanone 4-phosphate synthase/GTP cyclohydrolase II